MHHVLFSIYIEHLPNQPSIVSTRLIVLHFCLIHLAKVKHIFVNYNYVYIINDVMYYMTLFTKLSSYLLMQKIRKL